MNNFLVGALLGIILLVSWNLQYYFNKKDNRLSRFKNHLMAYKLDWLLFPFNLFWPFAVNIDSGSVIMGGVLGAIGTTYMHIFWSRMSKKGSEDSPFYKKGTNKFSRGGVVHYIYTLIQVPVVIIFVLRNLQNIYAYICLVLLVIFLLLSFLSSKKIHGYVKKDDAILIILTILILCFGFFMV